MWTHHTDSGNSIYGGQTSKNIYLGETRIVTKLNAGKGPTYQEEYYKQYFYHSDHLGSASLISDYKGNEYQRIEYTPYGETWVEKTSNTGLEYLPYKFTAKELDEETGLYYYGARYLDPKYSMWISTDPALGEYIPKAPINEEAKRYNQNLPGMGGVFNHINGNLYHYAGNNPVKYTDPDGRQSYPTDGSGALAEQSEESTFTLVEASKNPGTRAAIASVILKFFTPLFIVGFCLTLQGSSISPTPALPPNYSMDSNGNIRAPNGTNIATIDQAYKHAEGCSDWADVDGWGKGTFDNENASLLDHFDRHGAEVGATTPEQYLNKAKGFAQNLKRCHKRPSYNKKTGELTGIRYTKNGKYVILDINTKEILSFGAENHNGDL